MILSSQKFKEYHLFNFLVFLIVLAMFLYLKLNLELIHCPYAQNGMTCYTCGLTRSFKDILHGDFALVNSKFVSLFVLIFSQVFFRPLMSIALVIFKNQKRMLILDFMIFGLLLGFTLFSVFFQF